MSSPHDPKIEKVHCANCMRVFTRTKVTDEDRARENWGHFDNWVHLHCDYCLDHEAEYGELPTSYAEQAASQSHETDPEDDIPF